jgi:hypothetical protein
MIHNRLVQFLFMLIMFLTDPLKLYSSKFLLPWCWGFFPFSIFLKLNNIVVFPTAALCSLDCGPHGRCDKGRCECHKGWTGDRCDLLPCDLRCSEHGQCKNGTCVCSQGWNGKHCTLRKWRIQSVYILI